MVDEAIVEVAQVEQLAKALLHSEAEQTVRDLARHVGDDMHVVLKRHGMMMKTTAGAIGVGVLAAVNVLGDTLEFARRSMDGDADDERHIMAAVAKLFVEAAPSELRLTAAKSDTGWQPPAGWMLVPVEPTEEMIDSYFDRCSELGFIRHINATAAWSAMIAAAPTPEVNRG